MNDKTPFKERVRQVVISCAQIYKQYYMEYEYLVCSEAFKKNKYYKFYATKDNYLHLTGVHSNLKPAQFFNKCLDDTLSVNDFDFIKKGQTESAVKGIVRKKIQRDLPYGAQKVCRACGPAPLRTQCVLLPRSFKSHRFPIKTKKAGMKPASSFCGKRDLNPHSFE